MECAQHADDLLEAPVCIDHSRCGAVRVVALISPGHELGLDVLLGLPCTVVDALDITQARTVGAVLQRSGTVDMSMEIESLS